MGGDYQTDAQRKRKQNLKAEAKAVASKKRKRSNDDAPEVCTVVQGEISVDVRRGTSDLQVLNEVFDKRYDQPRTTVAKIIFNDGSLTWHIFDVGANIGVAALFLLTSIGGQVRALDAFEADAENMELTKKNIKRFKFGHRPTFHEVALVGKTRLDSNGQVSFTLLGTAYNRYRH